MLEIKYDSYTVSLYMLYYFFHRAEQGRIEMMRLIDNACRVTVKNTGPNDTGTWKFTMQDGHGKNRELKQYNHIVNIQILGNISLSNLTEDRQEILPIKLNKTITI